MKIPVPTLSQAGWVTGISEKVDVILSHFITSEYNQSDIYRGNITSFTYIIATFGNDELDLINELSISLEKLFTRYFDNADISVTVKYPDDSTSRMHINIDIRVQENGIEYSAGSLIESINSKFVSITKLNNG